MNIMNHVFAICALVSSLGVSAAAGTAAVQTVSPTSPGHILHRLLSVRHGEQLVKHGLMEKSFSSKTSVLRRAELSQQPTISSGPQEKDARVVEADKLLDSGVVLLQQNKVDEAMANFTKAAQLNPDDFRPHALTGLVYMQQMKFKSASEMLATAIKLRPQSKELYLIKAAADVKRNATEEAIAACRKALGIDPNYAEAYAIIGESLRWDEKRRAEAVEAFRKAIQLNPSLLGAYDLLGQILEEAKDQKGAEEVFRQELAADTKHMSGRFALGRLLVDQGRLAEAREIWDGRTSDDDNTKPMFIDLLKRAENLKRATDALAQKPKDPDAIIDMGLAVMEGNSWVVDSRQKRAIVYFRRALELKPKYARAQYAIVKAYIQIADTFADEKKKVDREMATLKELDPALADELEAYRKKYVGGIIVGPPVKLDQ